jgi:hypothetical protein
MATINTTLVGNTITVNSTYAQGLGAVARLGSAQREFTSNTVALVSDIFFKFYSCDDSTGTKVYSPIDVTSLSATAIERFLTMVFLNYYSDSTIVNFLSTTANSFSPLAQRLSGVVTPDVPLASTLTMPANTSNFVEFVGMGLGSYFGAKYVNDGVAGFPPGSVWGTRVGQVHITSTDPLGPAPIEALYDNSDSGCWQFSDFNTNGVIVYTNLTSGAFNPPRGLGHWGQVLCLWPVVSELLNAQFACLFNNLDQSFMQSGLGYFDRLVRKDTFYGWAGNYIQSIFNDWGIPVVSPLYSLSDLAIATLAVGPSALANGSLSDQAKLYRFVGPRALNNVTSISEKSARSLLPLLWANECVNNDFSLSAAFPPFLTQVQGLGYADGPAYVAACLSGVGQGYNAHLYKYILDGRASQNNTPTNTRLCVQNGVSWSATLSAQPSLLDVFTDASLGRPKYYKQAITDIYPNPYASALNTRISFDLGLSLFEMSPTEITRLISWVYTP